MRIYLDCYEMVREVERDLYEMGIEYDSDTVQDKVLVGYEKKTLELYGYSYCLKSNKNIPKMMEYMKCNMGWAIEELEERIRPKCPPNPGEAWKKHAGFWTQFLRKGFFSYTYTERLQWQIPHIIEELRQHPNSRQAILTMYSAERDIMNFGGLDRVPCSVSYQFLYRNGKLHVIYNQRSCDFLKFFAYDIYYTMGLRDYIAGELGMEPGDFIHFLGSTHAFKKDLDERGIY